MIWKPVDENHSKIDSYGYGPQLSEWAGERENVLLWPGNWILNYKGSSDQIILKLMQVLYECVMAG